MLDLNRRYLCVLYEALRIKVAGDVLQPNSSATARQIVREFPHTVMISVVFWVAWCMCLHQCLGFAPQQPQVLSQMPGVNSQSNEGLNENLSLHIDGCMSLHTPW